MAESHLNGAAQQSWLDRLEQEHANLRLALAWGVAQAPEQALHLSGALGRFWHIRGYYQEGSESLTAVLELNPLPTNGRAKALMWAGTLQGSQGEQAWRLCQESLHLYQKLDNKVGTAQALAQLGGLAHSLSDGALAAQHFAESLSLWRELGNKAEIARALTNCAQIAREYLADYSLAENYLKESLGLSRELNNTLEMAYALNGLAGLASLQGNYPQEAALLRQSLQLLQPLGVKSSLSWIHCGLGENAWYQGHHALAYSHYQTSLTLFQELGSRRGTAIVLYLLGQLAHHQGNLAEAVTHYRQSLQISHAVSFPNIIIRSLAGLGGVALQQGHLRQATRLLSAVYAQLAQLPPFLTPADRAEYDEYVQTARQQLGETFATLWSASMGRANQSLRYDIMSGRPHLHVP
jgi:tetratricopeptide (TPR) repeat protein